MLICPTFNLNSHLTQTQNERYNLGKESKAQTKFNGNTVAQNSKFNEIAKAVVIYFAYSLAYYHE